MAKRTMTLATNGVTVIINGEERTTFCAEEGTLIEWSVSADGYQSQSGSFVLTQDVTMQVVLYLTRFTFTIQPTPSDATVIINGEQRNSITVLAGTEVSWEVSADGYVSQSGTETITEDTTKAVALKVEPFTFVYDNNSMYIYRGTACNSSSTACLFAINGDYDIEINGVMIENVTASTTFGSEYLNDTGNVVKIYTHEGTTINHRYNGYTNGSTYNQTKYISEIQTWGGATFLECAYMFAMSGSGASTLKKVPKFSEGFAGVTSMAYMFYYCNSLTELADGLFDNCTAVTNFQYCFRGCSGLTSLPTGLFDNCTKVTNFQYCFYGCSGLSSLPTGLFDSRTAVTNFGYCFYNCSGLTSLPTGLFDNCTAVTNFQYCFYGCSGLSSLPTGLFANCTAVTNFQYCFYGCSGLSSLPTGLFDSCTEVTDFNNCFRGCSGLSSLPTGLFDSCTEVTDFSYCFASNSSSTHNLEGESAYDIVTIDGVETVIHLYERENYPDIYTKPSTTSYCYRYQTKLDDYDSIPSGWK